MYIVSSDSRLRHSCVQMFLIYSVEYTLGQYTPCACMFACACTYMYCMCTCVLPGYPNLKEGTI